MCAKTREILTFLAVMAFCCSTVLPSADALREAIHNDVSFNEMLISIALVFARGVLLFPLMYLLLIVIVIMSGFVMVLVDSYKSGK